MKKEAGFKKYLEILFVLVVAFCIVVVIFVLLYFGFDFAKKTLSGNVVEEGNLGGVDWAIISVLACAVVMGIIKMLVKKKIIKFSGFDEGL